MCLVLVFSIVGDYWGRVETGPFFVRERTVDSKGGGVFKNKYPGRQTP